MKPTPASYSLTSDHGSSWPKKRSLPVQNAIEKHSELLGTTDLILMPQGIRSGAAWIASADAATKERFLNELTEGELLALPYLFEFWAHDHQLAPHGPWRTWVCIGGRGAGKTRAGAEWVRNQVEGPRPLDPGRAQRVALIGETYEQVRDVMIFGDSGILAVSPPDRRPKWEASKRRLVWPNGASATAFSASDPEALRGPQFDAAWCDELGKWKRAQDTWDMLQFALRLGDDPRQCVTTTPRSTDVLKTILSLETTVSTHAATEANAANLADSFLKEVRARYAGTRLGRQELDGIMLETIEGAMWNEAMLRNCQTSHIPDLDRIVVAIDPPVTSHKTSDECGLIVAGLKRQGPPQTWRAYVLADESLGSQSPLEWAARAVELVETYKADRVVAEVNQGGDLVETVLRQIDPMLPYRAVRATRGKSQRAEPIAALYEQGRIFHARGLGKLEDQLCQMSRHGYQGKGSPDRVDALVWALSDLMLDEARLFRQPSLRVL